MADGRRRAYIKQQAAAQKKHKGGVPPNRVGPSIKRKPSDKTDRLPKKPKVATGLAI